MYAVEGIVRGKWVLGIYEKVHVLFVTRRYRETLPPLILYVPPENIIYTDLPTEDLKILQHMVICT